MCCILASGPFALQPYYSTGENVKFHSTSHVNKFLMMTNDRGERCHSEKASQSSKKRFFSFFHFFHFLITFFEKVRPPSFGIQPSVKFIGWQTKKTVFEVNHALPGNGLRSKIERMEHLHV